MFWKIYGKYSDTFSIWMNHTECIASGYKQRVLCFYYFIWLFRWTILNALLRVTVTRKECYVSIISYDASGEPYWMHCFGLQAKSVMSLLFHMILQVNHTECIASGYTQRVLCLYYFIWFFSVWDRKRLGRYKIITRGNASFKVYNNVSNL